MNYSGVKALLLLEATFFILLVVCLSQAHGGRYNVQSQSCNSNDHGGSGKSGSSKKLEYELASLTSAESKLKNKLYDIECKLKDCKKNTKHSTDKIICLTNEKNTILNQVNRLQTKINQLECQLKNIQGECDLKKKPVIDENQDLIGQVELLAGALEELGKAIDQLTDDVTNCGVYKTDLQILYDACLEALNTIDPNCLADLAKLEAAIKAIKEEIELCKADPTLADLEKCRKELQDAKDALDLCTPKLIQCQTELPPLQAESDTCANDYKAEVIKVKGCVITLDACETKIDELKFCAAETEVIKKQCWDTSSPLNIYSFKYGVYLFHYDKAKPLSWFDANDLCGSYGMRLLKIDNKLENDNIAERMFSQNLKINVEYWIGLNDLNSAGQLVYSGWGSPVTYIDWADQQPSSFNNEHCIAVNATKVGTNSFLKASYRQCADPSDLRDGAICEMMDPCSTLLNTVNF